LTEFVDLPFRDGTKPVPPYIASLLEGISTIAMTYDEAIAAANRKMEADFLNAQQDNVLAAHFREQR